MREARDFAFTEVTVPLGECASLTLERASVLAGWEDIFTTAIHLIAWRAKAEKEKGNHRRFEISQVKEKFGELRIYMFEADDYIRAVCDMAGMLSESTCAMTGRPGQKVDLDGYLIPLCDEMIAKARAVGMKVDKR